MLKKYANQSFLGATVMFVLMKYRYQISMWKCQKVALSCFQLYKLKIFVEIKE